MSLIEAQTELAVTRRRVADLVVMQMRPNQTPERLELLHNLERSARAELKLRRRAVEYERSKA